MNDPVKPRRGYRSAQRADQAAANRAAMIEAARALFIGKGWEATTIAGVARAAKLSPETVYAVFGGKAALFAEVVRAAVRRDAPDTPLVEQRGPQGVAAASGQREVLRLFARDIAEVLDGVAGLMAIARGVAASEPEIGAVYRNLHEGRRRNLELVAQALRRTGRLRGEMSEAAAVAVVWRIASPELYLLLREIEGMDRAAYAQWLEQTLAALLLP